MSTPPPPSTPAGWYPDPSGSGRQRYFDGRNWTNQWAPAQAPPTVPPKKTSTGRVILGIVGGIFLLVVIGSAVGGTDADKKSTASSSTSQSATSPGVAAEPTATETVAPAGSSIRDGKFEFRVLDIETAKTVGDPTGNPYMQTTAQGTFIVITMSVQNIGDEPQSYFGQNQKLIDASGREYGVSSAADMWMNTGNSSLGDINPGNSIRVKMAFDVPPGTNAAELELHDSMFSGGASVRLA